MVHSQEEAYVNFISYLPNRRDGEFQSGMGIEEYLVLHP